ncbi:MAG: hypothetical protein IT449_13675 [Phycisphaerales bacterium]|nr:hypothetical protein [Phycisphaerales bacterium]
MLLAVAAPTAYWYFADPQRVAEHVRSMLREQLGAEVRIGRAGLAWPGRVELSDLTFSAPRNSESAPSMLSGHAAGGERVVVTFSRAEVTLDPRALLHREFKVTDVRLVEPRVRLDAECARSVQAWLAFLQDQRGSAAPPTEWPAIQIERAGVTLTSADPAAASADSIAAPADPTAPSRDPLLVLDIDGAMVDGDATQYAVRWRLAESAEGGVEGSVRIDIRTGRLVEVRGGTPWLSIDALAATVDELDVRGALPEKVTQLCHDLGTTGRMRLCDMALTWSEAGLLSVEGAAHVELDSISIPTCEGDAALPPEARYARFDRLHGEASLAPGRIDARLSASFHGAECALEITALEDPAHRLDPFAAAVAVRGHVRELPLPRNDAEAPPGEAMFMAAIPAMEKFWARYAPQGRVNAEFLLTKAAGRQSPIESPHVKVTALDCQAAYDRFPYLGEHITGVVEVTPLGVFVNGLRGHRGDGTITLNAWTADLAGPAATRVAIEGRNIALDEDLRAAVPEGFRAVWDQFAPSGRADLRVSIERPGEGQQRANDWSNRIEARLHDAALTYKAFPYRIESLDGNVTITDHGFQVDNLVGRHGEATLMINGAVEYKDRAVTDLDIHVEARGAAADRDLFAALPARVRDVVVDVGPKGCFDASAAIYLDPAGQGTAYDIDVFPRELTVCPRQAPVRVEQVTGRIRFNQDQIELDRVAGEHRGAFLRIDGTYDLRGESGAADLTLQGAGLRMSEEIQRALPARVRDALGSWSVDGPIGLTSHVRTDPRDSAGGLIQEHEVRLSGTSIKHADWPAPLESADAKLVFDATELTSLRLEGVWNGAQVAVSAERGASSDSFVHYRGEASIDGLVFDDRLAAMLPPGQRELIHSLKPVGAINLRLDTFELDRPADGSAPAWSLTGRAVFDDLNLPGAAELANAGGTLTFSGDINLPGGYTSLNGLVLLDRAHLLGKRLSDLSGDWTLRSAPQDWSRFTIDDVEATAYDGALTGEVNIATRARGTEYEASLSLSDMDIGAYLRDGADETSSGTARPGAIQGRLDGTLTLTGRIGSTMSRRGEGRVAVHDARLYHLPIMLAILRVINLAESDEKASQDARATFSISGQQLTFHELYVRDPATALAGEGTCYLPDQTVNLRLIAVSPHDWARVPVLSELVEGASRELMELEVTGPVSKPQVRPGPLRGLKNMWQTLFPEKPPQRR